MAALPYIQLYIPDYLADTTHLTTEEHGAYLLLLFNYWQRAESLPNVDSRLANICRLPVERWLDIRPTIVEFFVESDGELIHNRLERDLQRVFEKSRKARKAGLKSAAQRAEKKRELNKRSTDVQQTYQQNGNHTVTVTDTIKKTSLCARAREGPVDNSQPVDNSGAPDILPIDWQPGDQVATRLHRAGCSLDPYQPAAITKFVAHWRGQGRIFENGQADDAYVAWMLKEKPEKGGSGGQRKGSGNKAEHVFNTLSDIADEEGHH